MNKKFLLLVIIFCLIILIIPSEVYADSLTDVMTDMSNQTVPEDGALSDATSGVTSMAGILISAIIYLFFALTAFTTATDLLYIAIPPVRDFLYPAGNSANAQLRTSVCHDIAQRDMNRAQQYAAQGSMYDAQRAQMNAIRNEQEAQYRDQNWFGNRERLENAQSQATSNGNRCLISSELRKLVQVGAINVTVVNNAGNTNYEGTGVVNKKDILVRYFKARSVSIVLATAVLVLLVATSVFTDLGLNIGQALLNLLGF